MFFPFTFSVSTPANPFAESADPGQIDYASPTRTRARRPPPPTQTPSQARDDRAGLSRKRGRWSPDLKARACSPTTDLTSTSAYIDTHGKSADLGSSDRADLDSEDTNNELRPTKRRRIAEITDTLISTAFSAAVIGTAVGLTAYRLWRDRGKEDSPPAQVSQAIEKLPPPPPYTERPETMQSPAGPSYVPGGRASVPAPATTTPTPRRAAARPGTGRRAQPQNTRRRRPVSTIFQRNQSPATPLNRDHSTTSYHTAYTAPTSPRSTPGPSSSSHQPNTSVQSGDELDEAEMEMSGQMDWMSSRLQDLINQGKKALGTEVVVGGADDVDDGAEGWDDEPVAVASQAHSSAGSGGTRAATRTPILGRSSSRASGAPRRKGPRASSGSVSGSSIRKYDGDEFGFEVLYQSPLKSAPSTKTSFDDGESEELKVAMERVRKAYKLG
ncbi:hypothetical protein FRC08_016672 [Ceratobasidium sp. 394]|nr:hypothetical protein FRC08_016672 [Ceratobasidium sp. 394]